MSKHTRNTSISLPLDSINEPTTSQSVVSGLTSGKNNCTLTPDAEKATNFKRIRFSDEMPTDSETNNVANYPFKSSFSSDKIKYEAIQGVNIFTINDNQISDNPEEKAKHLIAIGISREKMSKIKEANKKCKRRILKTFIKPYHNRDFWTDKKIKRRLSESVQIEEMYKIKLVKIEVNNTANDKSHNYKVTTLGNDTNSVEQPDNKSADILDAIGVQDEYVKAEANESNPNQTVLAEGSDNGNDSTVNLDLASRSMRIDNEENDSPNFNLGVSQQMLCLIKNNYDYDEKYLKEDFLLEFSSAAVHLNHFNSTLRLVKNATQIQDDKRPKRFLCIPCGFVYCKGIPKDELEHIKNHAAKDVLMYNSFAAARVISHDLNERVVVISGSDYGPLNGKILEVMSYVDRELGCKQHDFSSHLPPYKKVYLYIVNSQVIGCLVVDFVSKAYRILKKCTDNMVIVSENSYPVKVGINRLWTRWDCRKNGIATTLIDSFRKHFFLRKNYDLKLDEIAFSVSTCAGNHFIQKYTKNNNYMVYTGRTPTFRRRNPRVPNDFIHYKLDEVQNKVLCQSCGFNYSIGVLVDETEHQKYHAVKHIFKHSFRLAKLVFMDINEHIVVISSRDSSTLCEKALGVISFVYRELGFRLSNSSMPKNIKIYLYILNSIVSGCLIVEPISQAYRSVDNGVEDFIIVSEKLHRVKVGVNCIWTKLDCRKNGIATKLMNSFRKHYVHRSGKKLELDEIAFTVPTCDGNQFIKKYTNKENYFVYSSSL